MPWARSRSAGGTLDVAEVLHPCLQCPVEGHQADKGQGREQDEPEGVERRTDVGGGGDQAQGDQVPGHRAEEHGRPAGSFGDGGGASPGG